MKQYQIHETVCLVAILKDEERFLDEWTIYHRTIGISHFFLYDDDPANPLEKFMSPHRDYCTVIPWHEQGSPIQKQGNQVRAYNHALINFIKPYDWVVFLDADEFIVLKKNKTIPSFLSGFKDAVAVSLNWHIFGHNGFINDPHRLITTSLLRRMRVPSPEVKTITRTGAIESITYPHHCNLKYGNWVDANNQEYTTEIYPKRTKAAHINHYECRSFSRWMRRPERGDVNFDLNFSPEEHKWRLDKTQCFNSFLQTISRKNNEHLDRFMVKYRYLIQEGIAKLDRRTNSRLTPLLTMFNKAAVDTVLSSIAKAIIGGERKVEGISMYHGKTGLAIFLFTYARYSGKLFYKKVAIRLLNEVSAMLQEDSPVNYQEGLAGYGAAIEYMVKEGFIKADTNDVLEDIDDLLHFNLITESLSEINIHYGITGIGKYYVSRLENPFNEAWNERDSKNKQILKEIIDLLDAPFNTHHDFLSVIDFLSTAYPHFEDNTKIKDYMAYAADKMETMVREDIHFGIYPNGFEPLNAAIVLLKAFKTTGDQSYADRVAEMLKYDKRSCRHQNSAHNMVRCMELAYTLNNNKFADEAIYWLNAVILECKSINNHSNADRKLDLLNGLSGTGMALLSVINGHGTKLLNLCPL